MIKFIQKLSEKNIFLVIGILFIMDIGWNMSIFYGLSRFHMECSQNTVGVEEMTTWNAVLFKIPLYGITEEITFRLFPLGALLLLTNVLASMINIIRKRIDAILMTTMILSSLTFGILHGNIYNVFMQGASGFMHCILFLIVYYKIIKHPYNYKVNDGKIFDGVMWGTLTSSVVHIAYNWVVVGIYLL